MKKIIVMGIGFCLAAFAIYAQSGEKAAEKSVEVPAPAPARPVVIPTEATHWTLAEVKEVEAKLESDPKTTSENPAFSMINVTDKQTVRRTSFGKTGLPEVHMNFTDIFCILNGECEFLIGGEVEGVTSTNPAEVRATSIKGGERKKAGTGDIVVIPPGIPHQIFVEPDHRVSFMVVKIVKD